LCSEWSSQKVKDSKFQPKRQEDKSERVFGGLWLTWFRQFDCSDVDAMLVISREAEL